MVPIMVVYFCSFLVVCGKGEALSGFERGMSNLAILFEKRFLRQFEFVHPGV